MNSTVDRRNGRWLMIVDDYQRPHVVFLPERSRHALTRFCACRPRIVGGVFLHEVITAAFVPRIRERSH